MASTDEALSQADGATEARERNEAQIRIDGLHKWSTVKMVREMLQKLGVTGVQKVKKLQHDGHGFVYFCSVAERYAAEPKIQGHVWKKSSLSIRAAKAMDPNRFIKRQAASDAAATCRPGKKPRQGEAGGSDGQPGGALGGEGASSAAGAGFVCEDGEEGSGTGSGGVGSSSTEVPASRTAADAVTPLHKLAYEDQLERKHRAMLNELRNLPGEMHRAAKGCPDEQRLAFKALKWLAPDSLRANGLAPCPLAPVTRSPLEVGYRNKCEFSVGLDVQGAPCVGFMLGQVRLYGVAVASPADCRNVSPHMQAAVARVQSFVQRSPLAPYDKMSGTGFWRQITMRQTFHAADPPGLLIVVAAQHCAPGGARVDEAVAEAELSGLVAHLQEPPLDPPVQLSITTECCDGPGEATPAGDSITRLGEPFIEERLLGLRFRVSGSSFFQVNTGAAEGLYALLRSLCQVGPDTVVLDVCCGTGTIGLCMASVAKRVIGIEMNTKAVQDARSNALLNSIPNAEFIASKAEAATRRVLSRLSAAERESLVAVVDPPRAGLHNDVIKALRGCLPLKRILFVSCHAPAFVRNAVGFCRPPSRAFEGEPFTPTRAFAVDLFPDTEHCELVVLLERQGSAQSKPDETAECQASAQSEPTDAPGGEPPAPELMPGVDGQQPVTEEGEPSVEVGRVSAEGDAEPVEGLPDS